ncbi:MAG: RNA ligase [Archaeoglobaceae archaeon]
MNFVAEALGIPKPAARRLEERNVLRRAFVKSDFFPDVVEAYRLDKKFGGFEEGTLIARLKSGNFVVRGFPKIKRILLLSKVRDHFGNVEVAVEEKMNGYNVRIVKMGENLYAITRGGLICPYTTEKARRIIPMDFFDDYPEHMLCCEAVGTASPYVVFDYGVEFDFYVFDIRHAATNEPVSIREKLEIAESYSLKLARVLAETHAGDVESIRSVVEQLEKEGREGIVIKDVEMRIEPLKYTTSYANCSDLAYAFRFFNEYARDFMISRIVREAFRSFELAESKEEFEARCLRLGRAILQPLVESVREVKEGKDVAERSKIFFYEERVLDLFKAHLRMQGVTSRIRVIGRRGGKIYAELERTMRSTTDRIRGILESGYW